MNDLYGSRILLRPSVPTDAGFFSRLEKENGDFVFSYTPDKHAEIMEDERFLHLSILNTAKAGILGHVILYMDTSPNSQIEFRRIVVKEQGKGYGREVIQVVKKLSFVTLLTHRLWLDVFSHNARAIRVYEAEGFVCEGMLRECVRIGEGYFSLKIYAMLEQEYFSTSKTRPHEHPV